MTMSQHFEESKFDSKANIVKRKKLVDPTTKDVQMSQITPNKPQKQH